MKGLLLKDIFTLTKQMKFFLVIIVIWTLIPGFSSTNFAIVYAAMLPITALAYDERSKWGSLAAMLPYSAKSIVLSKYILGYITIIGATILSLLAQTALALIQKSAVQSESFVSLIFVVCLAAILQSINLPFMFKFGIERGRLIIFVLIAVIVGGGIVFGETLSEILASIPIDLTRLAISAVFITLLINLISINLCIQIYKQKEN